MSVKILLPSSCEVQIRCIIPGRAANHCPGLHSETTVPVYWNKNALTQSSAVSRVKSLTLISVLDLTGCARHSLALGPPDGDVVRPDDVHQHFDVSVRQILSRHLLSFLPLRFQRSLRFSQLEKVYSQDPDGHNKQSLFNQQPTGDCSFKLITHSM